MKFIIVITMMFLNQPINPSDKPVVEVNTLNGVPLEFNTIDICYKHVRANLYHLKPIQFWSIQTLLSCILYFY